MVRRNRGHIINISSTAGSWPYAGGNVSMARRKPLCASLIICARIYGTAVRVTDIERVWLAVPEVFQRPFQRRR